MVHIGSETVGEARGEFIGALALLAEQIQWATESAAAREFVNTADQDKYAVTHLLAKSVAQVGDVLIEFAARLHNQFGGGRRGGGADIGDKIGDGEIGFVAYAGNYGNFGGGDGADNFFFIENPEIFERAATARDYQDVYDFSTIEELNSADNFRGGAIALDAHGVQSQMHVAEAAAQDANDIANGGAARRGDEADAAGEKR
jgi:hypothetical protein